MLLHITRLHLAVLLMLATLQLQLLALSAAQSEGGLFSKLMMLMMKSRRRHYVPFPVPFNPLSYSPVSPFNYPSFGVPIGGYPSSFARSALMSSLNGLGPLAPLGGINPLSFSAFPLLANALKASDQKLLSRSSSVYEPTVLGNAQFALSPAMSLTNPISALGPQFLATSASGLSSAVAQPPPSMVGPTLTAHSLLHPPPSPTGLIPGATDANAYSVNGTNPVNDRPMSSTQGELIKQQLREHYLNGVRWQLLRSLREQAAKDHQIREQYLKELRAKTVLPPLSYLEMYEEV